MRFVVYGAGAVGGVLGAALHTNGHDVVLIARGAHLQAIRERGLRVETPDGAEVLPIPVVGRPSELGLGGDDVVILTMKSQDTSPALDALSECADASVPIVCAQNGVDNERQALRRFRRVYAMCVMCPTLHVEPGVVRAYSSPTVGVMDVGCFPRGTDGLAETVAAALRASAFSAEARADIMRWKYRKLLLNLANVIEAACGPAGRRGDLVDRAVVEAEACLRAAGIPCASAAEDIERRGQLLNVHPVQGESRPGGSSWQSLQRGLGSIETDYLNGEIALLGRLVGMPTPINDMLQALGLELSRERRPPGGVSLDELLGRLVS